MSDEAYARISAHLADVRARVDSWFAEQSVDVWLMPLGPGVPRPRGEVTATSTIPDAAGPGYEREVGFTPVASFAGLPALTLPVGQDPVSGARWPFSWPFSWSVGGGETLS